MRLLKAREGMAWQRYSRQIWAQNVNICHWLGQHTGLDLCPPASPEFTGPWNEMPRPLLVITLKLHHLFLNVKRHLPHLNFDFSTHITSKIGRNCCEMWNLSWILDTDLNSKLYWPYDDAWYWRIVLSLTIPNTSATCSCTDRNNKICPVLNVTMA